MDRGEQKAFLICGKGIPSNYALEGLTEVNIEIEYEQYLQMCDIGIKNPGIYLVLKAGDDAATASVKILNADTQEPACRDLSIEIADRTQTGQASFEELANLDLPYKILEIKADQSQDFSYACEAGLIFPEGKWPSLSLLSPEDVEEIPAEQRVLLQRRLVSQKDTAPHPLNHPVCTNSSIRALVKVQGQQRSPAKIVIAKVKLEGGRQQEGVAYATLPEPAWRGTMKDEDAKYIDVKGVRTRYFEKGTGDALLLVHGGQPGSEGSAQDWEQNFYTLSRYFHVYALDRLGQGYTDNHKTDEEYQQHYQRVVDHVYGFIKAVGINKVHLVGHSQGGWPVTRIALDHPEMVKSLVNVDGSPAPPDSQMRSIPFFMYMLFYLHPSGGPTLESTRRGMEQWSYTLNNITAEKIERNRRHMRLPKMIEAAKQMAKNGVHPGSRFYLPMQAKALEEIKAGKLQVPIMLVWGYHDVIMHNEVAMELFKTITNSNVPGSRIVFFDNCDHFVHIEYPDLFNRTIKNFCGAYAFSPVE
jgi:pimeloyl-ACP methyl ester carboxylesterase